MMKKQKRIDDFLPQLSERREDWRKRLQRRTETIRGKEQDDRRKSDEQKAPRRFEKPLKNKESNKVNKSKEDGASKEEDMKEP